MGKPESHNEETKRKRLVALERKLADLQARQDLAMSAFKFDEANALQLLIAACEAKQRALAADMPAPPAGPEPPSGVVPKLLLPTRQRRARRRR